MPRIYEPKQGAKTYKNVDEKKLAMVKRAITSNLSYRKAEESLEFLKLFFTDTSRILI